MHYRSFGRTGWEVSEIGIGTWQLGGTEWGEVDDDEALGTLRAAADAGVTFIDTADIYGGGRSERLIGRFLAERDERFYVATKLGRGSDPGWPGNFTREAVRAHTEGSLERLGVEAIDLTQLHCVPFEVLEEGEIFEWLRQLRLDGKIRHFGASVESMEEAALCLEQDGLSSLQIIFNIFRQKPIFELFDRATELGVAVIVRLPLSSGLLGGKMSRETTFAATDHRSFNRDGASFNVGETFSGIPFEVGLDVVEEFRPLVPEGMTMAQMALRWCLDFPAVSTVIPGAKRPDQARANAAASDFAPLSRELHERLHEIYVSRVADEIRGPY
jgi:aryl-alcohol dehydrogenase-like predicted oxidoreductase